MESEQLTAPQRHHAAGRRTRGLGVWGFEGFGCKISYFVRKNRRTLDDDYNYKKEMDVAAVRRENSKRGKSTDIYIHALIVEDIMLNDAHSEQCKLRK